MTTSILQKEFTIETLTEEHVKSAMDVYVKSFCNNEPITHALDITCDEYKLFASEVLQKAVKEGMGKVVLDKSHRVIACVLAEDMSDTFIPHIAHYPKMKAILALLDEVSKPFTKGKKFMPGKIVHVWITAVDQTYRGRGLSTLVAMSCVESAARKGYDYAYAEFTNQLTENITHQFKVLHLVNELKFYDFIFEGKKPFGELPGSVTAYLAAIRPGIKIESIANTYKLIS